jgi:hypothetical protein
MHKENYADCVICGKLTPKAILTTDGCCPECQPVMDDLKEKYNQVPDLLEGATNDC